MVSTSSAKLPAVMDAGRTLANVQTAGEATIQK